jgi:PAS domain S-box-containing protein
MSTRRLVWATGACILMQLIPSKIYAQPTADTHSGISWMYFLLVAIILVLVAVLLYKERTLRQARYQAYHSDQRFRKLYDAGLVGLSFINLDGKIVHANKAFLNIIGYTEHDVESGSVNWNALTPTEYMESSRHAIKQMREQGFCQAFEKEYIRKDGQRVNVMLGSAMLDKNDFAEAVTYVIDISYRKQAEAREQELNNLIKKQREELYRILMDAPAMIVIRRGPELKLEFSNKTATNFSKSTSSMGLTTQELIAKFKVMADPGISQEVYRTGKPYNAKAFHLRMDRNGDGQLEDIWMDAVLEPVYDNEGNIDGVAFFGFDVTELIKANEEAQESEKRFRFLTNAIQHKLWTAGPDGQPTYYNKEWYDYTGKTDFEDLRQHIWEILHPDDLETAKNNWARIIENSESSETEQRFKNSKGEYLWHLSRVYPHKDDAGNVIMWIGTSTNIHAQKLTQKAMDELLARKDEFLGIASHELKTPITSLKASLQILDKLPENEFNPPKVQPFITMANKQVKKLTDIVDDLLDVTKIQSGKMQLNITEYLFRDSVMDCIDEIQQYAKTHKIVIETNDETVVKADRTRLEQVMINLLSNAVKYSPGKDKVIISIERSGENLRFAVTDFGIGIPQDMQSFIFDRFFRVHEASQNFSGLGLGLYISAEIVKQHGGKVGMRSEERKGSTFWFELPVTPPSLP